MCMLSCFSCIQLFPSQWTTAHQAPLSMQFAMHEHWSGLPCPSPGDLPEESNSCALSLLHWQTGPLPLAPPGKPICVICIYIYIYIVLLFLNSSVKKSLQRCQFNHQSQLFSRFLISGKYSLNSLCVQPGYYTGQFYSVFQVAVLWLSDICSYGTF